MTGTLRDALLRDYREGQGEINSAAAYAARRSQWLYFNANYGKHFRQPRAESP